MLYSAADNSALPGYQPWCYAVLSRCGSPRWYDDHDNKVAKPSTCASASKRVPLLLAKLADLVQVRTCVCVLLLAGTTVCTSAPSCIHGRHLLQPCARKNLWVEPEILPVYSGRWLRIGDALRRFHVGGITVNHGSCIEVIKTSSHTKTPRSCVIFTGAEVRVT